MAKAKVLYHDYTTIKTDKTKLYTDLTADLDTTKDSNGKAKGKYPLAVETAKAAKIVKDTAKSDADKAVTDAQAQVKLIKLDQTNYAAAVTPIAAALKKAQEDVIYYTYLLAEQEKMKKADEAAKLVSTAKLAEFLDL